MTETRTSEGEERWTIWICTASGDPYMCECPGDVTEKCDDEAVEVVPLTALTQERERADKWRTLAANQSSDLRTAERQLHEARTQVEELKRIIGEHMQAVDREGVLHHCGEPLCEANWWLYWAAGLVEKQPYEQKGPHTDRLSTAEAQLKRCQEALREIESDCNEVPPSLRQQMRILNVARSTLDQPAPPNTRETE